MRPTWWPVALTVAALGASAETVVDYRTEVPSFLIVGEDADDTLGVWDSQVLAAGDLTGDDADDLVVGNFYSNGPANGRRRAGQVLVFFGPIPSGRWDLATRPADLTIHGPVIDADFGYAVLVADVDGDGQDDLVASAPWAHSTSSLGEVNVFHGPLSAGEIDLATSGPDLKILGPVQTQLGTYLATGDVTGDASVELVVAAEGARNDSGLLTGRVFVLRGPLRAGPVRDLAVSPAEVDVVGADQWDFTGSTVAVGDVSGDGRGDLIVGIQQDDGPSESRIGCGAIAVLFGPLAVATVDLAVRAPDVTFFGADAGDMLGIQLVVADVGGDGVVDVVSGMETADGPGNGRDRCGETHVWMSPIGPGVHDLAIEDSTVTFVGPHDLAFAGGTLAVSPPRDGVPARLLIGARAAAFLSGRCWVFDDVSRLPAVIDLASASVADLTFIGPVAPFFGSNAVFCDFDADGSADVAIGAMGHEEGARTQCGAIYGGIAGCGPQSPSALRLRRGGDDVDLRFEPPSRPGAAVNAYRGTLASLTSGAYDHGAFSASCALVTGGTRDVGAAAPGAADVYYLVANSCEGGQFESHVGNATQARRPMPRDLGTPNCP